MKIQWRVLKLVTQGNYNENFAMCANKIGRLNLA